LIHLRYIMRHCYRKYCDWNNFCQVNNQLTTTNKMKEKYNIELEASEIMGRLSDNLYHTYTIYATVTDKPSKTVIIGVIELNKGEYQIQFMGSSKDYGITSNGINVIGNMLDTLNIALKALNRKP